MTKPPEEGQIWEWRAFGNVSHRVTAFVESLPIRGGVCDLPASDVYLIPPVSEQNVKLRLTDRGWVLKFKLLLEKQADGVELYHETARWTFTFPVSLTTMQEAARLLDVRLPDAALASAPFSEAQTVATFGAATPAVVKVETKKVRSQYHFDGGWLEIADVDFGSRQVQSLSLHSPNLETVGRMIQHLHPDNSLTVMNYVEAEMAKLLAADPALGLVATACVDAAVWDAVGKALGQPLWRLWGGYRRRLTMIAIGGYYGEGADVGAEVEALRELGVGGLKMKVGGLDPHADADRVREARRAGGDDFVLAADANQAWTPQEAVRFARLVEDVGLAWLEEPCRWHNDLRAMRDVRYRAGVPICAGQSEYSARACADLILAGAIDVCNFDASWSGGPTEWRRVAGLAHACDVRMGHHEEPQVAGHLLASIPHGTYVECFHPDRDPIWWNLVANRPVLRDGAIEMGDGPGLGWELDEDFLEAHRVER